MAISPETTRKSKKRASRILGNILCPVLTGIGFLCFFSAKWYVDTYGRTGFDSVVYTLTSDLGGVQIDLILSFLAGSILPALLCSAGLSVLLLFPWKRVLRLRAVQVFPFPRFVSFLLAVVISLSLTVHAAFNVELPSYLYDLSMQPQIFDARYVDPNSVSISFPEEKRNLVYIYLESMETSYFSTGQGGALEYCLIPELYALAEDNINFSESDGVGGGQTVTGSTWTIAAMVSHTAGIPLKLPPGVAENDYGQGTEFLPGVTSLMDILDEQGYYQSLKVGSVSSFGGRKQYYKQHGADKIYDLSTARRDGIVAPDYFEWWGIEDKYLFEYAKQELAEIAAKDEPFAFSMLTVDTHHIGGYKCEYCGDEYAENYENVMACSSRQVAAFVKWLQEQDFYENTTIIITGDHCSMDNGYFSRNVDKDYTRRIYNCFINSAADTVFSKNRAFTTLDMFPTTLAAMGCTVDGDRLGLGTDLFSGTPTLAEEMGYEAFNREVAKQSDLYNTQFLQIETE